MSYLNYSYRRQMIDEALHAIAGSIEGTVLDLGGKKEKKRGRFLPPPIDKVKHWHYLNSDPAEKPDVLANGESLPFCDNSFDWIICTEVLEFIHHPDQLISEIARTLKPCGRLFLTSPFLYQIHGRPYDCQRLTEERLRSLVSGGRGLRVTKLEPQGFFFTVLADFIKSALAHIPSRLCRYPAAVLFLPLVLLLRWLDDGKWIRRSEFFQSFTTGYALLAEKRLAGSGMVDA